MSAVRFFLFNKSQPIFSGKRTQEKHIEDAIAADQNQDAPVQFD